MSEFTKKTTASGAIQYRNATENKIVSKDKLSPELLARLDVAPEGTKVAETADIVPTAGTTEGSSVVPTAGVETREIVLTHPILVNGKVYKANEPYVLPVATAEDYLRIDREHTEYEASLVRSRDYSEKASVRPQDVQ